jgi:PAS domain S-box-containing protein
MEQGDDNIGEVMTIIAEADVVQLRMLLVEDDPDDAILCRAAIGHSGLSCHMETAGTLRDAIEWLDRDKADVALVDLSLPDAHELDAILALAQRFSDLPIVVLTGMHDEAMAIRALQAGAEDYLVKGVSSRESIGRAVRYAIERKSGEQTRRARDIAQAATHRAEQNTRIVEHNYRQLFDGNPYPVYVFGVDSLALLEVNDAAVEYYGYSREELLTLSVADLCLPEDVADHAAAVAGAALAERWGPLRQVRSDGTVVQVNMTSHQLSFAGRNARCVAIEDVTEKEQADGRLRQSQRLESLGQLAGGVAHDFNNLLGIIIGYATMCSQDIESAALTDARWTAVHHDIGQILQAGDRATNLTHQLLSFARARPAVSQVLDLNVVVTGLEQLLRRTIGEDIEMTTRLADDPWSVRADLGQIEQVLLNLVINARDAMPAGGHLGIECDPFTVDEHYALRHPGTHVGRYMRLQVTDTGGGMTQATVDRAFEPFFTTKPKGRGTGLGLATIYGIVTQTGGMARIDSELGVGTTFTAMFPATDEAPHTVDDQTVDVDTSFDPRDQRTILIAEDEDSLRLLTERILTRRGYTVIAAASGAEAIQMAADHDGRIDLLLADVIMPNMNGHDLAMDLKEIDPTLAVVYMSGYAEPLLATRSTLPTGVVLLTKPVTEHQLLAAIRRTLAGTTRQEFLPTAGTG